MSCTEMRRDAKLMSLPSKIFFLVAVGTRCAGKTVVQT